MTRTRTTAIATAIAALTLAQIAEAGAASRWSQTRPRNPEPVTYQQKVEQLLAAAGLGHLANEILQENRRPDASGLDAANETFRRPDPASTTTADLD